MKSRFCFPCLMLIALAGGLLSGCVFKPVTVTTRHFVLTPISSDEPARSSPRELSVGIGYVKLPPYLLRNAIAIRTGAGEIGYFQNALWGERLDQGFQRTVAANLSRLLPSDSVYVGDWGRDQVMARVFIDVQQYDVDAQGHGALTAQWRIVSSDSDAPLKSGHSRLARAGVPTRGNPEAVATTLSELAAEFSRELAPFIRECVERGRDFKPAGEASRGR